MDEVILNGMLEEELPQYYHICFYTDREGPDPNNPDRFIFVPKSVCRVIDTMTVSVLDWYVKKKKLLAFVRGSRRRIPGQPPQNPSSVAKPRAGKPNGLSRLLRDREI